MSVGLDGFSSEKSDAVFDAPDEYGGKDQYEEKEPESIWGTPSKELTPKMSPQMGDPFAKSYGTTSYNPTSSSDPFGPPPTAQPNYRNIIIAVVVIGDLLCMLGAAFYFFVILGGQLPF
jgi:hypothetical protein